MMFAGLTSAYLVKRAQSNWLEFGLPKAFYTSTVLIIVSSITMFLAVRAFKARERKHYRLLISLTCILGLLFGLFQWFGFQDLGSRGIQIFGNGSNPAASFLGVIVGLHFLHVFGGIVALIVTALKAYKRKVKSYDATPIEVVAIYWHFVDILWIYLFIFFAII
ncbi:MAG: cytochrome oxidase subunit III [Pseudopedobacter saltans]|uniref:Cytochrome oxidase subunit III n=1 Tax=Pseudopedobacter saltans TaxID=151895 RepID=A0A2W5FB55_9SPHI|nr:MAG: cytochrome oxidase subunit III [Pseudopedobacter saltans]